MLGNWVYGSMSGPTHRLDVTFKGKGDAASRYLPHGMVGQSFASLAVRHGKRDFYPLSGRMRTTAMAEGAIEGDASMYEVAGPFATDFRFSRFAAALLAVSSGLLTDGDASAISDAAEGLGAISDAEAAYAPPPLRRLACRDGAVRATQRSAVPSRHAGGGQGRSSQQVPGAPPLCRLLHATQRSGR